MRVTAFTTHPEVAPSTRFRVVQYETYLSRLGIDLDYDFLFDAKAYGQVRSSRSTARRAALLMTAWADRRARLRAGVHSDVVLVLKELSPLLPGPLFRALDDVAVPLVFDFDDSVFLPKAGGSRLLAGLARPAEWTAELCRRARFVLPGNDFLADFARGACSDVDRIRVLPTVVDTSRFRPGPALRNGVPVVGWVGSHSTLPYLLERASAFRLLSSKIRYRLRIVSNAPPPPIQGVDVEFVRWQPELEVSVFHGLSVGVYPLRDDHWTRGKCGFKAIQYLACGVPVVASPVGVLRDIVTPEETGLWAETDEEWSDHIERILRDPETGARWGDQGRALIEDHYSIDAGLPILSAALSEAAGRHPSPPTGDPESPCVASQAF